MRFALAILGLLIALGSGLALRFLDGAEQPYSLNRSTLDQPVPDTKRAITQLAEALRIDSANPYRWNDLADAFQAAGDLERARYCHHRALVLARDVPQLWVRDANFHFGIDEPRAALASAARVLKEVPDYDDVLFNYFDRLIPDPAAILAHIGDDRRAVTAYVAHLININNTEAARLAWKYDVSKGFADVSLTSSYVDMLLRSHLYSQAQQDWAAYVGKDRGDYPALNLLFNSSFERPSTGAALDWRITPSEQFETARDDSIAHDGRWSLRIRFLGNANVSYSNVIQTAVVRPGRYVLRAWVRFDGLTTNEGPRIEVFDPEAPARLTVRTDSYSGSQDWMLVNQSFTVTPATHLLAVRIIRDQSRKFDSKINGRFWIDTVRLTPE